MFLKVPVIIVIRFDENNVLGQIWIYIYISLFCPVCVPMVDIFIIFPVQHFFRVNSSKIIIIIIIYHEFLTAPRRGSHVKSDKTHAQSSRYTP